VRAREHIAAGYRWIVDLDIEKFFDRVNHDVLMARVAQRVKDKRVLRLIPALPSGRIDGKEGWCRPGQKGLRKEDHCHHSYRTSCSMSWIANWSRGDIASSVMRMTVTCMCSPRLRVSE